MGHLVKILIASAATTIILLIFRRFARLLNPYKGSGFTLTPLRGPSQTSLIFGVTRLIRLSPNPKEVYGTWVKEYGSVYRIPLPFGSEAVVVTDLKAVAHIFGKDTFGYVKTPGLRIVIERVIGKGVLWVEGEDHRRQRKALNPAFSPGTTKTMAPIFYDTAYRLKSEWDKLFDSGSKGGQIEVEMHEWSMKLTLDTVGRAVFGHDFHTLEGRHSSVEEALRDFNTTIPSKLGMITYAASIFVPWIGNLPTKRNRLFRNLSNAARSILDDLLEEKTRGGNPSDQVEKGQKSEKSLLELLIDMETDSTTLSLTQRKEEILSQMKAILIAGSDPPGLTLVWSLIELARNPEIQARARAEINSAPGVELDWNYLQSACPYLDAFISEVLRLRPPTGETPRVTNEDEVLKLKEPIKDISGQLTDKICLPKGTKVIIPNHFLNTAPTTWGPDALKFNPDRWLEETASKAGSSVDHGLPAAKARSWSFGEGPRVCVGKAFAMTQLKIVLAVLLHEYSFALPQGPTTPIDLHYSLMARPKIRGQVGGKVPLLVARAR